MIVIENRRAAGHDLKFSDGRAHVMEIVGGNLTQFRACSAQANLKNKEQGENDERQPVLASSSGFVGGGDPQPCGQYGQRRSRHCSCHRYYRVTWRG
jgi:hypothetical protein